MDRKSLTDMGRSYLQVSNLTAPLAFVLDRAFSLPLGQRLRVDNVAHKVIFFLEGQLEVRIDGRPLGIVRARDGLVVPGSCRQEYLPISAEREARFFALVAGWQGTAGDVDPNEGFAALLVRHFGRSRILPAVVTPEVLRWIELIRREAEIIDESRCFRVSAAVTLLLTEAVRQAGGDGIKPQSDRLSKRAWVVRSAREFVLEHLAEHLTLEKIAWHVGLSAEHLARVFKQETGGTIFTDVLHRRIEQAKMLLISSALSVTEIGARTGFSSATLFCRNFRRVTGETPLAYRRKRDEMSAFGPSQIEGEAR